MPATDWNAISAIAAVTAAVAAIVWQLVEARHQKIARQIDLLGRFEAQFEAPEFRATRGRAARYLMNPDPEDRSGHDAVLEVANFFEAVGYYWRKGVLDDECVWSFFSYWLLLYYGASRDVLAEVRRKDEDAFAYIGPMYDRIKRFKQKRNPMRSVEHLVSPARLREALEDEAALQPERRS